MADPVQLTNANPQVDRDVGIDYALNGFSYESTTDADLTLTDDAGIKIVGVDTSTSAVTVTIPSSLISNEGTIVIVRDEGGNATTNNITIATEGSENIDGSSTASLTTNDAVSRIYANGSNLFTI